MFSYSSKIFPVFLVVLLIFLQYRLWFQADGMLDMWRLKHKLNVELQENAQLKKRNDLLLHQVHKLQNNNDSIESSARHELGMVKKGEIFYQVVE